MAVSGIGGLGHLAIQYAKAAGYHVTAVTRTPGKRSRKEPGRSAADQAALYGVLAEAEALGLELIEVRRLPPEPSP
jgi:D-arabinose 1-dehydrogenase-like Zn-dependent alcohol dehydrogenase